MFGSAAELGRLYRDSLTSPAHLQVETIGDEGASPFEFDAEFFRGHTPRGSHRDMHEELGAVWLTRNADAREDYALFMHSSGDGIAGVIRLGGHMHQLTVRAGTACLRVCGR